MKILFTDIHHGNGGGHVTYIMSLLQGLKDRHQIVLAVPPSGRLFRYACQVPGIRVQPGLYTSRLSALLPEVRALRRFLVQEQFDVVHVSGSSDHRHVMLACLGMRRAPAVVWTKHNLNRCTSFGHRLRAGLGTTAVIAVSEFVHRQLQRSPYQGLPLHVVRHGVDLEHYAPVSREQKASFQKQLLGQLVEPDTLVLGSTGGTDLEKGWLDLVQGVAQLPTDQQRRVVIVVAGDPPRQALQARLDAIDHQARVIFPGLVDDIRTVLGACDAGFVLSHREALSYAARESLAMGLPTLVSASGGLPENLRSGEQGWIVPVGDHHAIAQVVQNMLTNPTVLADMGKAARQHSLEYFALNDFVDATEAVYIQAARAANRAV